MLCLTLLTPSLLPVSSPQLLYDGNEEEYEDFYDYSELEAAMAEGAGALVASAEELAAAGGYELVVAGGADGAGAGKVGGCCVWGVCVCVGGGGGQLEVCTCAGVAAAPGCDAASAEPSIEAPCEQGIARV
jgi:hypothetical protein